MAHWFHRNPLKATAQQNFELKMFAHDVDAIRITSELKQTRLALLQLLPDPHHDTVKIDNAWKAYFSVLRGFFEQPDNTRTPSAPDGDQGVFSPEGATRQGITASKLRYALRFRWTHSMLGSATEGQFDAVFEAGNLLMDVAFWYMKHAAMIAAKEDLQMEEAKHIHTSLRKSAGIIKFVQDTLVHQLLERTTDGADLDVRVISAYMNQCTAEAQEITIARAVELKHNPGLVSSLAYETSKMYTTAADSLATLDQKIFGHWRQYFVLKTKFYQAYAFCYQGESVLAQDKCGEAIRALQESQKCYSAAVESAKEFAKTKGPGTQAKPEQHPFFKKLAPVIKRTLEKCERENALIFHDKVPYDPPDLTIRDKTFGLVSPEPFVLPEMSPLWTAVGYAAFDVPPPPNPSASKSPAAQKAEGDLKPVKEVEIKHSEKDPKNESGCSIS